MERGDFNNNIEWMIYRVTGRLPKDEKTVELQNHKLPSAERVNDVKFYYNKNTGRYGALYHNNFLCTCREDEIKNVQTQFDKEFNGDNLEDVTMSLKTVFNVSRRYQTYKDGNLRFSKKGDRLTAHINHDCKTHTICSCYPSQKDEVTEKFNTLRKTRDLESIKKTMKKQYNIQGRKKPPIKYGNDMISLNQNGTIYKNGKLCKVDPQLYEYIDKFIGG